MFDERHKAALQRTADRWDALEKRIKRAERVRAEVIYPAISELRYAGRRIIDALRISWKTDRTDDDIEKFNGYIAEVENNCLRAEHDVVDALVLFVHKRLDQIIEQFGLPLVREYFPQYIRMIADIRRVDNFISKSRTERDQRPEIYTEIYNDHLPKIMDLYDEMLASENMIMALVEKENAIEEKRQQNEKYKTTFLKISTAAAVISVIIAIIAVFVAINK